MTTAPPTLRPVPMCAIHHFGYPFSPPRFATLTTTPLQAICSAVKHLGADAGLNWKLEHKDRFLDPTVCLGAQGVRDGDICELTTLPFCPCTVRLALCHHNRTLPFVSLSISAADAARHFAAAYGLPPAFNCRLARGDKPLDPDRTLHDQGVKPGDTLELVALGGARP